MKLKITHFLIIGCFLLASLSTFSQAIKKEQSRPGIYDQLDTRVDNMGYWMKMAEKGLTPYNPSVAIPPAVYKGSQLRANGVRTTNSPDVPVTNLTNVTESENSVFVDPNNADYLLNSNNSTTWTGSTVGSLYGANYFQSSNAGIGWTGSPSGAGGANRGDPTTAISLAGREYVNFISSSSGQGIAWSDDGTTWSTASVAPNPGSLADKNHMWIDNKVTSPYEGNLYVAWTDFGGTDDTEIKISRSTNDGATWSTPLNISSAINAGSHNQGVNIQTGPNGQVYVAWAVYDSWPSDETTIAFAKSTDGGATYQTATRAIQNIKGIRNTAVSKSHRVNSFPSMAVDISNGPFSGNIYIVWTNVGVPGTNTGTNKSVYMARSSNGGTTWSTPVRVNQGPNVAGKEAYFPWISCDPETGVLSVVFYDDRNVSSTQCEVFVAYSADAGNTWTDFQVSDVAFTPASIPGLASGYMGDYLGITSKGGKVYPCWTDNRGGIYMTYVSPFELGLNAGFSASATTICKGSGVTFTDVSTGPPTSWTWSFPGGTPSAYVGQNPPVITYNTAGVYDVILTVSDGITTDTETKTGYITVKNVIADFTGTPTSVVVGNNVTFTDNSSCSPASWEWSFPGGSPASYSGQTPPPINYSTLGTYNVSLTVTNVNGTDTKTKTNYITVAPPVFNMTNGTVTTCTGDFYDSGGPSGNYLDNEVYVMTFYPGTAGSALRFNFTAFNTETGYDTLTIYDGINSSAPMIGKYHGITGPGMVTANNGYGALTFRFRSDVSLTYSGWAATISCVAGFVPNPVAFTATTISSSQINLNWTKNLVNNDVMVVWAPTNVFGIPIDGTVYTPGSTIAGGGTVLYKGSLSNFSHTGLNANTTYYYKLYSCNTTNNYSTGLTANATTTCGVFSLPLTENFPVSTLPNCWTKQTSGTGSVDKWTLSNTANAGGTAYEMKSTYQSVNPGITRLVTPPFNTVGMPSVNLSFKHMLDGYATGCTLRIQSSADGISWTNEAWSLAVTAANVGPVTVNTTIAGNINIPTTYIAFTVEGDLYQYDYWYIDNVLVTSGCTSTLPVNISISSSNTVICQGTSVTFTASPVNGGTNPSYLWKVNGISSGTNSPGFSYIPSDNDIVNCILTSNALCTTGNPATSNSVSLSVSPAAEVSVNISASANPSYQGDPVDFTAVPVNGGTAPVFQWKVNGINQGTNNAVFTYIPVQNDTVTCVLTSDLACTSSNPAISNSIVMEVSPVVLNNNIQSIYINGLECFDARQTITVAGDTTHVVIQNGGIVTMIAGQNILFLPGFKVVPGGYLHGYIEPNGPWCQAPTKVVIADATSLKPAIPVKPFFRVYPNPTTGTFTLALKGYIPSEKMQVSVFNMKGEKVMEKEIIDTLKAEFSLDGMPSGLYLVRVDSESRSGSVRLIKIE